MDNEHIDRPYRLGVALSGGGARGFAHAGALMAIEEAGLRPALVPALLSLCCMPEAWSR